MNHFPKRRPSDAESIEARAAAWLAQQDEGMSLDDQLGLAAWRDADPRHAAALDRLSATWSALQSLREYRPGARAYPDADLLAPRRQKKRLRWQTLAALPIAAALVFAVFAFWPKIPKANDPSGAARVFATTEGGFQRFALEDGTVVELNANSEVVVNYTLNERRIALNRGEAHFTVAPNPQRPFWVQSGEIGVRAVGTAFDVRAEAQCIEVLVTAGIVAVNRHASPDGGANQDSKNFSLLAAGWRAVVPRSEGSQPVVEKIAAPEVRQRLAWQGSRLTFTAMPLKEVIEQFNQRNDVQMELADEELGHISVAGSFAADNLEGFVRLISSNGDIVAERSTPDRILLRKAR